MRKSRVSQQSSRKDGGIYFGLSGPLVDLSASQDSIEFEASVLVDRGEGIEIQMTASGFIHRPQGVDGKR